MRKNKDANLKKKKNLGFNKNKIWIKSLQVLPGLVTTHMEKYLCIIHVKIYKIYFCKNVDP